MDEEELDRLVLADGLRELDRQVEQFKWWIARERWSEAYVGGWDLVKLLYGIRRVIERLEKGRKT